MDITQFGADGSPGDICSDQLAFETAAQWFNVRQGNGELYIPRGTYILGRQSSVVSGVYLSGVSPLDFYKCYNFTIRGDLDVDRIPTTILKYDECLKYGSFDPFTDQRYLPSCNTSCVMSTGSYFLAADIGACVSLRSCGEYGPVTVMNLEVDGNAATLQLGGKFGEAGIQLGHDAVSILNSRKIVVNRIKAHDLGRDGIIVHAETKYDHHTNMQITIMNSSFNWNGRNGFSWTGGSGVTVKDCTFDLNGLGVVKSPPSAGLDIEVEGAPVRDGVFIDCEFKFNRSFGVISDPLCYSHVVKISNHKFSNCTMVASEKGIALWPDAPAMTFESCNVHGMTVHVFDADVTDDYDDRCIFTNCNFFDSYMGPGVSDPLHAYCWLINTTSATLQYCGTSLGQAGALDNGGPPCLYAMNPGNLYLVDFTNFTVEYPEDLPNPIGGTILASYCSICTCDMVYSSCAMIDNPLPLGYFTLVCPPQYLDPVIPSLDLCIHCEDTYPGIQDCDGHPDYLDPQFCVPYNVYPCCGGCDCYLIAPVISCAELHE